MDRRIQLVVSTIDIEFGSTSLNSAKLARLVNLSTSRLQHLFKAEIGETLLQCLKKRRMREAEKLLRTQFLSGKEVMNRVGLFSYSNFVHDFKREYGVAPVKYSKSPMS